MFSVNFVDYNTGGSTLGQGARALQITCLPAPRFKTQKLADRSDVISEAPKCSKIRIFRGSAPDPAEELTALP